MFGVCSRNRTVRQRPFGIQDLQNQLSLIESEIQMARRYYNGTVRNLNILIDSFPSNLVAGFFDFRKADFFQTDEADRAVPKVGF